MSTVYRLTPEVAAILEGQDIDEVLGFLARMAVGHVVNKGVNKALPAIQSAFQDAIAYEPTSKTDAATQMDKLAKLAFHPSSKGTPEGKLAYDRLAKVGQKHGIDHKDFLKNPKKYLEPDRKVDIGQTASNLATKAGLSPIKKSTWADTMAAFKQGMGEAFDPEDLEGMYGKDFEPFNFKKEVQAPMNYALQCQSCGTSFTTKPRTRESSYSKQREIPLNEGRSDVIRRMLKIQERSK